MDGNSRTGNERMPLVELNDDNSITLPDEVVQVLKLKPGDRLSIEIGTERECVVRPHPSDTHSKSAVPDGSLPELLSRKNLETPVRFIPGVGPRMAEVLSKRGVVTVEDALYLLPIRYEDRRRIRRIAEVRPGKGVVFAGKVLTADTVTTRGGRRFFEAILEDGSGSISCKWFHYNLRFMKSAWKPGRQGVFFGDVLQYGPQREVHHPEVEWLKDGMTLQEAVSQDRVNFGRIVPVYPLTEGLHQKTIRKVMKEVVEQFASNVWSPLPQKILDNQGLLPLDRALAMAHAPGDDVDPALLSEGRGDAHRSLAFDEFFYLELGLALRRRGVTVEEGIAFQVTHRYTRDLLKMLPFSLTEAQRRVLSEIKTDMMAPHPMHRLVQGDVGSGKTLVALMAALIAVENDYQVAIMAPTEILAEQHYLGIHRWCETLGIPVALLTSSLKGKAKKEVLGRIADGTARIAIGTHAMIQEKVDFHRLGLGIVDEQHRFGVLQRGLLRKKGVNPDLLVMTATPIPRTLAMTVFGDLSLSVIDELPPGRSPIETRIFGESKRRQLYETIEQEVRKGHQVYIIYPMVEETETSELKAATQMAAHLAGEIFPEFRVGLLHGRMGPEEKEAVMASFKSRQIDILVATTVIEVGIDVPNASLMVVEHAERFGLSQLHQLRGRVGRGSARSMCVLMVTGKISEEGRRRLEVMESTCDGFRIAEADLQIRGPGDFLGTRQAGLPDFRVASILRDGRLLEEAAREAFAMVEADPELARPEHVPIRRELIRRWGGRLELAGIA